MRAAASSLLSLSASFARRRAWAATAVCRAARRVDCSPVFVSVIVLLLDVSPFTVQKYPEAPSTDTCATRADIDPPAPSYPKDDEGP